VSEKINSTSEEVIQRRIGRKACKYLLASRSTGKIYQLKSKIVGSIGLQDPKTGFSVETGTREV